MGFEEQIFQSRRRGLSEGIVDQITQWRASHQGNRGLETLCSAALVAVASELTGPTDEPCEPECVDIVSIDRQRIPVPDPGDDVTSEGTSKDGDL